MGRQWDYSNVHILKKLEPRITLYRSRTVDFDPTIAIPLEVQTHPSFNSKFTNIRNRTDSIMAAFLDASKALFGDEIPTLLTELCKEGQEHLFTPWSEATDENKLKLATQLKKIDASTEGGLLEYIRRARKLLDESKRGP